MSSTLHNFLTQRIDKLKLIDLIQRNKKTFEDAVQFALSDLSPEGWRASWLLAHCCSNNDKRMQKHIDSLIINVPKKQDGHQRELLKILIKMDLNEEQEGELFDECMNIWEAINKSPSVRITAFKIIAKIVKKYPELYNEIKFLSEEQYIDTLSSGIKNSFHKLMNDIRVD